MTYYRKDLFDKAGIKMPDAPTYAEIRSFADKITDKPNQTYGMCPARQARLGREHGLRHLAGECRGRPLVRHGVEADPREQAVAHRRHLL